MLVLAVRPLHPLGSGHFWLLGVPRPGHCFVLLTGGGPRKYRAAAQTVRTVPGNGEAPGVATTHLRYEVVLVAPHQAHHTRPQGSGQTSSRHFFFSYPPLPRQDHLLLLLSLPTCCIANSIPAARFFAWSDLRKGTSVVFPIADSFIFLVNRKSSPGLFLLLVSFLPPCLLFEPVTRRCPRNTT